MCYKKSDKNIKKMFHLFCQKFDEKFGELAQEHEESEIRHAIMAIKQKHAYKKICCEIKKLLWFNEQLCEKIECLEEELSCDCQEQEYHHESEHDEEHEDENSPYGQYEECDEEHCNSDKQQTT